MAELRLIDANVLIDKLHTKICKIDNGRSYRRESMPVTEGMRIMELEYCIGLAECEPVIDAVPVVHGRWIERIEIFSENEGPVAAIGCSACGTSQRKFRRTNYRPNCGAKMDGGAEG